VLDEVAHQLIGSRPDLFGDLLLDAGKRAVENDRREASLA